jgi:Concanavalin A-like lectin/glucanases superfamily/Domain of unknown function (DUF5011)/Regulator of chromosome condensation (RCC1) repeat
MVCSDAVDPAMKPGWNPAFVVVTALTVFSLLPPVVHAQSSAGNALSFNGTNYVSISTTGSITGTFTVEAWVNPANTNGFSEILSTRVPVDFTFDMQLNSGVGLHGDIGNGGMWLTTAADATFAYTSNQWFHAAYVVTPTNYLIYANGQRVGSNSFSGGTPILYNNIHSNITLATWFPGASQLSGQLDEVRVWNIARTQAQIQSNMTMRLTGTEPGLVDYYRLDEPNAVGATTLTLDSTGRGNRGTLVNRPFRVRSTAPLAETVLLYGPNPLTNECHVTFVDPGATTPPRAIATGSYHNLALKPDGTVVGWGDDSSGEISPPASATNVVAIATGSGDSVALRTDGAVLVWGENSYGQTNVPASATNVVALSAGAGHILALRADGRVVGWGFSASGETNIPPDATNIVAVAGGYTHSLALRSDGTVIGWGDNSTGEASPPAGATNGVAIAAGTMFSLALKADGTVVGWGDNTYGETNIPPYVTNVVAIAAGQFHGLALKADGTVVSWGFGGLGQTNVPSAATNVVAIAANGNHSLALRADGTIFAWGDQGSNQPTLPGGTTGPGVFVTGTVNANSPGSYLLTYTTGTNSFGVFNKLSRTVVVADTQPPQLSLNGPNPVILLQGMAYVEPGAIAPDLCAGDLSSSIVVTGSVNVNVLGTNFIGYKVTDSSGNATNAIRLVIIGNKPAISGLNAFVSATNLLTETRTVTFDAAVNPNTQATAFYYEFGPTAAYGGGSAKVPLPGSLTDNNIPFPVSGLGFGTSFHWNVIATNYFGMTVSPDQVVTVPAPFPPGDLNGDGIVSGSEFSAVVSNYLTASPGFYMTNVAGLGGPNVTFAVGNSNVSSFSVETTTNLTNWQYLGPALPRYLFTDTNFPMGPKRFYRLRYP